LQLSPLIWPQDHEQRVVLISNLQIKFSVGLLLLTEVLGKYGYFLARIFSQFMVFRQDWTKKPQIYLLEEIHNQ
jgi:hypothetical protein